MPILIILMSIIIGCSEIIISIFISLISKLWSQESRSENQLRSEIVDLKRRLQSVSMVDQFPTYAKLQRSINDLSSKYKIKINSRKLEIEKMKFYLSIIFKFIMAALSIVLLWKYRTSPVVSFKPELLWPLGPILALPSCESGDISFAVSLVIVRSSSTKIVDYFNQKKLNTRNS